MPDWLDSPTDALVIVSIIGGLLGVVGAALAFFMWMLKAKITEILHELLPNSGRSLRDAVNRVEAGLERLEDRFERHLDGVERSG